jgi:hypothetical protein
MCPSCMFVMSGTWTSGCRVELEDSARALKPSPRKLREGEELAGLGTHPPALMPQAALLPTRLRDISTEGNACAFIIIYRYNFLSAFGSNKNKKSEGNKGTQ